ncbi:hypothetical protein Y032_0433g1379 [Ancylostoma ceylanicum]|uniref:Uncharacterized protein n=1 Tax=Ancylostoma ceylanicum TaxID=53326 RepID=A0A016WZL9_9BILA|nr:hypothetical protein Y032_0433g1379 [Ancylostoma ceylanicum]
MSCLTEAVKTKTVIITHLFLPRLDGRPTKQRRNARNPRKISPIPKKTEEKRTKMVSGGSEVTDRSADACKLEKRHHAGRLAPELRGGCVATPGGRDETMPERLTG